MGWYLAARRALVMAVVTAGITALTIALMAATVPMPSLLGGAIAGVPSALLLPAAIAAAVVGLFAAGPIGAEVIAARHLPLLDAGLASIYAGAAAGLLVAAGEFSQTPLLTAGGRNVIGYTGVALLALRFAGPVAAPVAPIAIGLLQGVFGYNYGRPRFWALGLADQGERVAAIGCAALFAIAIVWLLADDLQRAERIIPPEAPSVAGGSPFESIEISQQQEELCE